MHFRTFVTLAAAALAASPLSAATLDFSRAPATADHVVFVSGGVTAIAGAGIYHDPTDSVRQGVGKVTTGPDGLGVDQGLLDLRPEITGAPLRGTGDLLTIDFGRPVVFESVAFGAADPGDTADLFIDGTIWREDVAIGGGSFAAFGGATGTTIGFGSDTPFSLLFEGSAYRVAGMQVVPVPLPATAILLLAALGLLRLRRAG